MNLNNLNIYVLMIIQLIIFSCKDSTIINLEAAIDWASKSYSDYGTKEALRYINVLRNRINDERMVNQQLSK